MSEIRKQMTITDKEFAVIQACLFYVQSESDGMTKQASKIHSRLLEKMNLDNRVGSIEVWE